MYELIIATCLAGAGPECYHWRWIHTGELFADTANCVIVGIDRVTRLEKRPGWTHVTPACPPADDMDDSDGVLPIPPSRNQGALRRLMSWFAGEHPFWQR